VAALGSSRQFAAGLTVFVADCSVPGSERATSKVSGPDAWRRCRADRRSTGKQQLRLVFERLVDQLRARPLVRHVHLNASAGCLVVDHEYDDPGALIALIQHDLRGWELAGNGEAVMVDLAVHEESQCRWAGTVMRSEREPNSDAS
jgi:hypothetical protein